MRSWTWLVIAVALTSCSASAATGSAPRPTVTASALPAPPPTVQAVVRMPGCTGPLYRPDEVLVACGDGNVRIERVHWATWSVTSATGAGSWQQNDCRPSCASGRFHSYPVRLLLSRPLATAGGTVFQDVVASFPTSAPDLPGYASHRVVLYRDGRPVV